MKANIDPGPIILMGSGETAPNIRRAYEWMFQRLDKPIRVAVLETAAGFEPNSTQVAGELVRYIEHHLQNFHPKVDLIPARKRGTDLSPDNPDVVEALYTANAIMLGPGSPTYAVKQLKNSLAWEIIKARHLLGAGLIFTSACTIATSAYALPVYEIFKVGEDIHWKDGLDLFGAFGLSTVHIPHWNTTSGNDFDTTRAYIGQERFNMAVSLLPESQQIIGLDDHTAMIFNIQEQLVHVFGAGTITLGRDDNANKYADGAQFPFERLGDWKPLEDAVGVVSEEIWEKAVAKKREMKATPVPPPELIMLIEQRATAREQKNWGKADEIRESIEALGWRILDTPNGTDIEPIASDL